MAAPARSSSPESLWAPEHRALTLGLVLRNGPAYLPAKLHNVLMTTSGAFGLLCGLGLAAYYRLSAHRLGLPDWEWHRAGVDGARRRALIASAQVAHALEKSVALKGNDDLLESLNTLFLIDGDGRLVGGVPLGRLFVATENTPLKELTSETLIQAPVDESQDRVTELFDKYNLLSLPVVDEEGKLAGVITADDIISVLRRR